MMRNKTVSSEEKAERKIQIVIFFLFCIHLMLGWYVYSKSLWIFAAWIIATLLWGLTIYSIYRTGSGGGAEEVQGRGIEAMFWVVALFIPESAVIAFSLYCFITNLIY